MLRMAQLLRFVLLNPNVDVKDALLDSVLLKKLWT